MPARTNGGGQGVYRHRYPALPACPGLLAGRQPIVATRLELANFLPSKPSFLWARRYSALRRIALVSVPASCCSAPEEELNSLLQSVVSLCRGQEARSVTKTKYTSSAACSDRGAPSWSSIHSEQPELPTVLKQRDKAKTDTFLFTYYRYAPLGLLLRCTQRDPKYITPQC